MLSNKFAALAGFIVIACTSAHAQVSAEGTVTVGDDSSSGSLPSLTLPTFTLPSVDPTIISLPSDSIPSVSGGILPDISGTGNTGGLLNPFGLGPQSLSSDGSSSTDGFPTSFPTSFPTISFSDPGLSISGLDGSDASATDANQKRQDTTSTTDSTSTTDITSTTDSATSTDTATTTESIDTSTDTSTTSTSDTPTSTDSSTTTDSTTSTTSTDESSTTSTTDSSSNDSATSTSTTSTSPTFFPPGRPPRIPRPGPGRTPHNNGHHYGFGNGNGNRRQRDESDSLKSLFSSIFGLLPPTGTSSGSVQPTGNTESGDSYKTRRDYHPHAAVHYGRD